MEIENNLKKSRQSDWNAFSNHMPNTKLNLITIISTVSCFSINTIHNCKLVKWAHLNHMGCNSRYSLLSNLPPAASPDLKMIRGCHTGQNKAYIYWTSVLLSKVVTVGRTKHTCIEWVFYCIKLSPHYAE